MKACHLSWYPVLSAGMDSSSTNDPIGASGHRLYGAFWPVTSTYAMLKRAGFDPTTEKPNASTPLAFPAMLKTTSDPVHIRRAKFIDKLEEQKLLLGDSAYIRTVQRMAEVDGQKQPVVRKQRVKLWWKIVPSGQLIMSIKFGAKPIEFEKGKAGIAVPSKDKLPGVIDTLIAAVRAGELDELLTQGEQAAPGNREDIDPSWGRPTDGQ
jgi:hypothetical protein